MFDDYKINDVIKQEKFGSATYIMTIFKAPLGAFFIAH